MANTPEEASLTSGDMTGSEEALVPPARPRGPSNSRALKVAGLTTLACLLLASQVFTAYMVLDQKQQISALKKNSEQARRMMNRSTQSKGLLPARFPIAPHPLLMDIISDDLKTPKTPKTSLQDTIGCLGKQLKDLIPDSKVPQFNETFLTHLQGLKHQMKEKDWQGFESWMRYWLIFQMAQQQPQSPDPGLSLNKTKCQKEAAPGPRKVGAYKPQCDEQGQYKAVQCWQGTNYCWCVDETGKVIEGTAVEGRPDCDTVVTTARIATPRLMQDSLTVPGLDGE